MRVIWYKENSRLDAIREKEFCAGYAFSHEEIVQYIMTIIPQEEVIVEATRRSVVSFPEIAIRELLANAMIHQDLQQRGTNPMVEVFKKRIEFSNAGAPLVAIERIVDSVPVSRNENIAGLCINVVSVRNVAVDMIRLLKQPAKMNYLHRGLKIKTINLQKQYCLRKYRLN